MVHLNRIYTRTGDEGLTGLGDGTRLPKHDARIAAYGTTDELNSVLGVALAQGQMDEDWKQILGQVQNDLFDVGADLCLPNTDGDKLRIDAGYVDRVESWIDRFNADLQPLTSFILPGGSPGAAWLHVARTVCRRAERLVCELAGREGEPVNPEVLRYLNRLSDFLFVAARVLNGGGRKDVLWRPGASRESS